jgi:hypothetical protein
MKIRIPYNLPTEREPTIDETFRKLAEEPILLDENGDIEKEQRARIDSRLRRFGVRSGHFDVSSKILEIVEL